MSVAADRARAPVAEPDRLAAFSSPREVDRLFGHDEALAEFASALAQRTHASRLAAGGARGRRQGDARLSCRARGAGAWRGGRRRRRGSCGASGVPQSRRPSASQSPPHPPLVDREDEALLAMDRRRRGAALARVSRQHRGRGRLAGRDRRPGGRAQSERGQRAAQGARGAAAADLVPADLERGGASAGHHPVAGAHAARAGARARRICSAPCARRSSATATSPTTRRSSWRSPSSQGSVRRALELVSGEGIGLYKDIMATFDGLPELDGGRLHKQVEKLAGAGDTERLELYLSLLLGLIERLIRCAATGEGALEAEQEARQASRFKAKSRRVGEGLGGPVGSQGRGLRAQSGPQPVAARHLVPVAAARA